MERNGHVREASSIRFDGINRLFRRALDRAHTRLLLVRSEVHRSVWRISSNDNAMTRHSVIEYVYMQYLHTESNSKLLINLRAEIKFLQASITSLVRSI